jgi:transcriptional regulator with XRE-family HTH domain
MSELITESLNKKLIHELVQIYSARKAQNPAFSLRAFGKKIGVSSGALSEMFHGKRRVTKLTAKKILENLNFGNEEIDYFTQDKKTKVPRSYQDLSFDQYEIIASWHYLSLLNFLELPNEKHTLKSIADRMGLSEKKIEESLKRLLRLEMIQKKGNRFFRTFIRYQTTEDVASEAIKKYHRATLELSEKALEGIALEARDFTSIVLKVHPKNLKKIKQMVREFQDELSEVIDSDDPQEIYHLNVHLYPITKREKDV